MKKYDYLIVGAGLAGSTIASLLKKANKKVLIIEKEDHIGGMCYSEKRENIEVHIFGPHIFHTDSKEVFDFVQQFSPFNNFVNQPKAYKNGKLYSLPYNMNTFYEVFNTIKPCDAKKVIDEEIKKENIKNPANFEEKCLSLVGRTIYEIFIKDYTAKQWKTDPKNLPASLASRLPLRFYYDNNYFNHRYQGIPELGYTKMLHNMIDGIKIELNTDFNKDIKKYIDMAEHVIYTGSIDELLNFKYGILNYRTLRFEHKVLDIDNYQGTAVINNNEKDVPYTRSIEHKFFNYSQTDKTVVSYEYPEEYKLGCVKYYPSLQQKDNELYVKYLEEIKTTFPNLHVLGRIAQYKYLDMDKVIIEAFELFKQLTKNF